MTDLFADHNYTAPEPPSEDDALAIAMVKQWERDKARIAERRVIPDWMGEPSPLSKDRARLLELLYDAGCVEWTGNPSKNNNRVTKAMGLNNNANAKAVLDMCQRDGLITSRLYQGKQVFEMAQEGEFALEDFLLEKEMGFL